MKQLDMFENNVEKKSTGSLSKTSKVYESPDKGKTIYEREIGAHPSTRKVIKKK